MSVRSCDPLECESADWGRDHPCLYSLDFSDSVSLHCAQLPLLVLKPLAISCQDLGPVSFSVTRSARETRISSVSWNNSFLVMYLDLLALWEVAPTPFWALAKKDCEFSHWNGIWKHLGYWEQVITGARSRSGKPQRPAGCMATTAQMMGLCGSTSESASSPLCLIGREKQWF